MSTKKRRRPAWRYEFQDGDVVDLSLVESEKARLRDMARRLEHPASTPDLRESGETMLNEIAQLLAKARAAKIGSDIGTAIRLKAGAHKAARVRRAITEGTDPLTVTSERNLRRIKKRAKK